MTVPSPTPEQLAVIMHPLKHHARVLAVAGSGKTTTIVLRVAYLIQELGVAAGAVRVFAYNAMARNDIRQRIEAVLPNKADRPRVDTFHSFAFRWIKEAITRGILPEPQEWWLDEESDRSRLFMHRAIQSLVQEGIVEDGAVDVDAVSSAITMWKSALIPAGSDRAAHASSSDIPLVYARYEEMRVAAGAVGFDDFVSMLLDIHANHADFWRRMCGGIKVVIVDEYQDVNHGQQCLIEAIAGTYADVMVVGDDDQTIYEWRGARPDYLLSQFGAQLAERPVIDYPLTVSFRFGPLLAQCAHNVIVRNAVRFPKDLVAADRFAHTQVQIIKDGRDQAGIIDSVMCEHIQAWCAQHPVASLVVIGRSIGQLQALELACLLAQVPYRVLGRVPFYQRREHTILTSYINVIQGFDTPIDDAMAAHIVRIANTPMRGIARDQIQQQLRQALAQSWSPRQFLHEYLQLVPANSAAHARIDDWLALCERVQRMLPDESAYEVVGLLVQELRLEEHFQRAFGRGEAAAERIAAVRHLLAVLAYLEIPAVEFVAWMQQFDHTAGKPEDEQVLFTTVYRVKGLEYDHVVIPNVLEGYFPADGGSPEVYDRANPDRIPPTSESTQAERRLFYVAMTRARAMVTFGVPQPAAGLARDALPSAVMSRFLYEMRLEPTETILDAATSDAETLESALVAFGASVGLLQHLKRYYHDDVELLAVIQHYTGELWPMRPARLKRPS